MSIRNELRQDRITKTWVVIAPGRGERPHDTNDEPDVTHNTSHCPFCPGHEAETPAEVFRLNDSNGGWRVRVVPNKFEVLGGDRGESRTVSPQGFVSMPGVGRHEVVIEMPEHGADLATVDVQAVRDVLTAYRTRFRALRDENWALIVIFRNHGSAAGTSLSHPHSQIVATPVVPIQIRHRFDIARQYFDDTGACLYLDVLEREIAGGRRIILEQAQYVAFQPFASAVPFETWIMPRVHRTSFGDASDQELVDLALVLRTVLGGLRRALADPSYNYVIESAPIGDEDRQYFVWHLRILPRLTTPAGFELGSGIRVNPSRPEETAEILRRAIDSEAEVARKISV